MDNTIKEMARAIYNKQQDVLHELDNTLAQMANLGEADAEMMRKAYYAGYAKASQIACRSVMESEFTRDIDIDLTVESNTFTVRKEVDVFILAEELEYRMHTVEDIPAFYDKFLSENLGPHLFKKTQPVAEASTDNTQGHA